MRGETDEGVGDGAGRATAVDPDALAPVRAALVAKARADAGRLLAVAEQHAAVEVAAAEQRAETVLAAARARGEADARALVDAELVRARREGRALVLVAQRAAYDDLRQRVRAAVAALRDSPGYPALRRALEERARAALGPDVLLTDDPSGGFVAESGSRRAVFTLEALADEVLERGGVDVDGLWRL
jgi:vacuolar-type H+-ATPase subunit E/Vma4